MISKQVEEYLKSKPSNVEISDYLRTIRENMKILEDNFSKDIILIFALMVSFYFLTTNEISSLNIGPVKIENPTKVYIFIPLIMAYLYYEISSISLMRRLTRIIHLELIKYASPSISNNSLEYYLLPTSIFLSNEVAFMGKKSIFIVSLLFSIEIITKFSFLIFEVYVLYYTYCNYVPHTKLFWIIFCISTVVTIISLCLSSSKSRDVLKYNII